MKFDFVVHFTNGGSLSAQDFRLDIPGSDITNDELAAYLIQDMHLLMAGRVDITNKQILEEPHKRLAISTAGLPQVTIDLSTGACPPRTSWRRQRIIPFAWWLRMAKATKSLDSWCNNSFKPTPLRGAAQVQALLMTAAMFLGVGWSVRMRRRNVAHL